MEPKVEGSAPNKQGTPRKGLNVSQDVLWGHRSEFHRLNFDASKEESSLVRWVGGFSILGIFYGALNYAAIQRSPFSATLFSLAFLSLLLCAVASGVSLFFYFWVRWYIMETSRADFNEIFNAPKSDREAIITFGGTDVYKRYQRWNLAAMYSAAVSAFFFFLAIALGAVAIFMGLRGSAG